MVRVWDAESEEPLDDSLREHRGWAFCAVFSADGNCAASEHANGTVQVWDADKGKPVGELLAGYVGFIRYLAFSADGKRVASG